MSKYSTETLQLYATGYIQEPLENEDVVLKLVSQLHKSPASVDFIDHLSSDDYNEIVAAAYGALRHSKSQAAVDIANAIVEKVDVSSLDELVLPFYIDHQRLLGNFDNVDTRLVASNPLGRVVKTGTLLSSNRQSQAHDFVMEQTSVNYACPSTLVSSAFVALFQQNFVEAQAHLLEAEKTASSLRRDFSCASDILCNALATVYMSQGKWQEAKGLLQRALKINENNSNIYANLVTCYLNLGQVQRANEYYRRLSEKDQKHPFVLGTREVEKLANKSIV